jgi:outer membrane lipoprotein-sorting protein
MELRRVAATVALSCSVLALTSCLARRRVITRNKSTPAQRLLSADKNDLLKLLDKQYQAINTFNATVDMVPAVGSAAKGRITEYKDVLGYILFKKPAEMRMIGLYPVVRNKAFDMVSNGVDFRLYVPSKNQFIVGQSEPSVTPSPNKFENLRPSVFLDALLVRPPAPGQSTFVTDFTDEDNAAYILHFFDTGDEGQPRIARDIWFDRLTLHIVRQMIFDPRGEILSDARYSDWKIYDGVPFPKVIDINRPKDEYGVVLTLTKADINKPITTDKFVLEQPEGTALHVLGKKPEPRSAAPAETDGSASRKKKTTE